ncbi:hypothetical protein CAPTEDRAFT_174663, partial [Capitella teleta]
MEEEQTPHSPLSTMTASSESGSSLRMTYNPTFDPGSRDPSAESVTSLISTSTGNSISPQSTLPPTHATRPHSITKSLSATTPGQVEDLDLFGSKRRSSPARRSARATLSRPLPAVPSDENSDTMTRGVRFAPLSPPQIHLTQIVFEVPHVEEEVPLFSGREWLFAQMEQELYRETSPKNKGVVLVGGVGSGKTAVIQQLMEHSCFGQHRNTIINDNASIDLADSTLQRRPVLSHALSGSSLLLQQHTPRLSHSTASLATPPSLPRSPSISSYGYASFHSIAHCVVAVHVCQADNNITCMVPELVHSVAAY